MMVFGSLVPFFLKKVGVRNPDCLTGLRTPLIFFYINSNSGQTDRISDNLEVLKKKWLKSDVFNTKNVKIMYICTVGIQLQDDNFT